ncbi:MAG TPA: hypothetical protein VM346_02095 [Sphingomicrobium sp.]|nr:hypothetical protein [Sphingomicrobium sp.]
MSSSSMAVSRMDTSSSGNVRRTETGFRVYSERPLSFLELWRPPGWTIKVYGLSAIGSAPRQELIDRAKRVAARRLAAGPRGHGVGWLLIHEGEDGDYVLIDWWVGQDMIQHHLYGAPRGKNRLRYRWPDGDAFCVWELPVCWFEREAWVRHVLSRGPGADMDAYLEERLEGWV